MTDPGSQFGKMDIYLLDQLIRGRIGRESKIFDAGCGGGRNVAYFLSAGYDVAAIDEKPEAIARVLELREKLAPDLPESNFRAEPVEESTFPDGIADFLISNAVLHFARDDDHFEAMLRGCWRLLAPGGIFFCRLSTTIGMEERFRRIEGRRFLLPGGAEWYLNDAQALLAWTNRLEGELLDPLKTTVVHDQRCMTTWVMRKLREYPKSGRMT